MKKPTSEEICGWCGRTYEDHDDARPVGSPVPKTPCLLLKSNFFRKDPMTKQNDIVPLYFNNIFICKVKKQAGSKIIYLHINKKNKLIERVYKLGYKYGNLAYIYEKTK